jgi:adenosylmethionine-8-amino-7-oxononanoate aminotransferase
MYHPVYLSLLRISCDNYGIHLIADEVAVGFGRTGTLFACEQAGISPDFLCVAKGLTGGYLPLAATLTTEAIYQSFYDDYDKLTAFFHSHSYTGNALACRAGIATLSIFQQQAVIETNRLLAKAMYKATAHFIDHPNICDVRQTGMVLAIEFVKNKQTREPFPWQERRGLRVYEYALTQGVLLRPLANVIYFMPPYIITEAQIQQLANVAWQGIQLAVAN